jgi:hypothetical protein
MRDLTGCILRLGVGLYGRCTKLLRQPPLFFDRRVVRAHFPRQEICFQLPAVGHLPQRVGLRAIIRRLSCGLLLGESRSILSSTLTAGAAGACQENDRCQ